MLRFDNVVSERTAFSVFLPDCVCVSMSAVMEDMKHALWHCLQTPTMQIRQAKSLPVDLEHGHHPDKVQTWATCAEEVRHHLASSAFGKHRIRREYKVDKDENKRLCLPSLTCISKFCISANLLFRNVGVLIHIVKLCA
jgi:hypothetical protein